MTNINSPSTYGLDNKKQADSPKLSVRNYSKSNIKRLSRTERRLFFIKKIKPQNIVLYQI